MIKHIILKKCHVIFNVPYVKFTSSKYHRSGLNKKKFQMFCLSMIRSEKNV